MWTGSRGRRSGFVLAAVLMISVVLIAATTGFAWFARNQLRRVEGERAALQSRNLAFLTAFFVARGLTADQGEYDALDKPQFQPLAFPAENAVVSLRLTPLDHALPLNALFLPDGATLRNELTHPWEELWKRLGRGELSEVVLDFLDADGSPRLGGGERDAFLNRTLADLSELLLCPGVTQKVLEGPGGPSKKGLRDFCTVWCEGKINVNTVSEDVLTVLHDGFTMDVAEALVAYRREHPFKKLEDFFDAPAFPQEATGTVMNLVGVKSVYFRLNVEIWWMGGRSWRYDVILKKDNRTVSVAAWEERY